MTRAGKEECPISDDQAVEIANAWHSVMTWNDPGVAMYSVSSTGKVHSEKHRAALLKYIDAHLEAAIEQDAAGEDPIVMDSNADDLLALREWVEAFEIRGQCQKCGRTLDDEHECRGGCSQPTDDETADAGEEG